MRLPRSERRRVVMLTERLIPTSRAHSPRPREPLRGTPGRGCPYSVVAVFHFSVAPPCRFSRLKIRIRLCIAMFFPFDHVMLPRNAP